MSNSRLISPSHPLKMLEIDAIVLTLMASYSLTELAKVTGTSHFAIRHYVKGRLLHAATRVGQSAVFDDSHVTGLRVIASLRAAGYRGRELVARVPAEMARVSAPPPPAPARCPTARDAVDAAVCAAAESLDVSPRGLRAALEAVLRRLHDAGISAGEAAQLVGRAGTDV